eukprot:2294972-Rhodomonas_salina.1
MVELPILSSYPKFGTDLPCGAILRAYGKFLAGLAYGPTILLRDARPMEAFPTGSPYPPTTGVLSAYAAKSKALMPKSKVSNTASGQFVPRWLVFAVDFAMAGTDIRCCVGAVRTYGFVVQPVCTDSGMVVPASVRVGCERARMEQGPRVQRPTLSCYEVAHAPTQLPCAIVLRAVALAAVLCAVLSYRMLLRFCSVMSGTEPDYAAMHCPGMLLRACYGMSGTDLAYAARRNSVYHIDSILLSLMFLRIYFLPRVCPPLFLPWS